MKIAFISSAVPVIYLKDNNDALDVIVLNNEKFYNTYNHARKKLNSRYKLIVLPKNQLIASIVIALMVLIIKILRVQIIIFHEACWPVLDIIINTIKPNGAFIPMSTLDGFTKLSEDESKKYIKKRFQISYFGEYISKIFQIYRHRLDNGGEFGYDWVIKKYPIGIDKQFDSYILERKKNYKEKKQIKPASVLLLVGSEPIERHVLHELYGKIIEIINKSGLSFRVKDHPLKHGRLNLKEVEKYSYMPDIAADFIFDEHSIAIGCASTALCTFPGKKASIINLINMWRDEDKSERLSYLYRMSQDVFLPNHIDDLENWLKIK